MNQLAILAQGGQTVTATVVHPGYQVNIYDPAGNLLTLSAAGASIVLPPIPFGEFYTVVPQNVGTPPVIKVTWSSPAPPANQYDCAAGGPPVVTITIQ